MSKREQNIRNAIRLIRSANVGPITYHQLIALYGSAGKALEALPKLAARGGGKRKIRISSESDADKELKLVKKAGAELLIAGDTNYPLHLSISPMRLPYSPISETSNCLKRPALPSSAPETLQQQV